MAFTSELIRAMESDNDEKMSDLLSRIDSKTVNKADRDGQTPLHASCCYGYIGLMTGLLAIPGIDVNVKDKSERTPLHDACIYNHPKVVDKLLDVPGIDVNAMTEAIGWTPVHIGKGWTPLHIACFHNYSQIIVELLAVPGIDVNAKTSSGRTALHMACFYNYSQVVAKLLALPGIDVNAKDKKGRTPLHLASFCDYSEVVAKLLATPGIVLKVLLEDSRVDSKIEDGNETYNVECLSMIKEARGENDHQMLEDARDSLKCPVCWQAMRPPTRIWMCLSSHLLCGPCFIQLGIRGLIQPIRTGTQNTGRRLQAPMCPICRIDPVMIRAHTVENFAKAVFY